MATFTQVYSAIAVNVSQAALQTAMGMVPLDTATAELLGLSIVSDLTNAVGVREVTRTIVQSSSGAGPIPDDSLASVLQGYYSGTMALALGTPVRAAPVVTA